jgi:WD40 repeat protein
MRAMSATIILAFCVLTAESALGRTGPPVVAKRTRTDSHGDPLPDDAVARFGTGRFRAKETNFDAVVSPDGKLLAVLTRGVMVLLDAATGKEVKPVRGVEDYRYTTSVLFSPDSRLMADIGHGDIEIRDLVKGKPVSKISVPGGQIWGSIVFSPDGKTLAVGYRQEQGKLFVSLYKVMDGKETKRIAVETTQHVYAVFSPNGKILVTWGQSESREKGARIPWVLHFWDVDSGKTIRLVTLNHGTRQVVFSPDSRHFVVSEFNSSLSIREVATGKPIREFTGCSGISEVAYSPDGKLLATAWPYSGVVQLWDTQTGRRVSQCKGPPDTTLLAITFTQASRLIATGRCRQVVRRWEVPSGRELISSNGHRAAVEAVVFSRDGKRVLSAGEDGMFVQDIHSGKEIRRWVPPSEQYRFVPTEGPPFPLFSPTGNYLLWGAKKGGHGRDLWVVDCSSGQEVANFGYGTWRNSFARDGIHLATVQTELTDEKRPSVVNVWDLDRGSVKGKVKIATASRFILSIAISPDGKRLVSAAVQDKVEQTILWDIENRKEVSCLPIPCGNVMVFSHDGAMIATMSKRSLQLWSSKDGSRIQSMNDTQPGNESEAVFSPDDRLLAVRTGIPGSPAPEIRLYELASGKTRASYPGHRGGTLSLAFSPDGRLLASGGMDTTVMLWDVLGTSALNRMQRVKPTDAEQRALWADLASEDARKAHMAIARLSAWPDETVALIQRELKAAPGKPPEEKDVQRMIADLGSDSFKAREKATQALEKAGLSVRPALLKALPKASDLENKKRIERLLDILRPGPTPAMLRPTRALEVLEHVSSAEARRLVQTLATGNSGARLTMEAQKVLKRMKQKQ